MLNMVIDQENKINGNGFMIGGDHYCEDVYYKDTLKEFEDKGIDATVFYGQGGWCVTTDVFYDRPNDTIYIAPFKEIKDADDIRSTYSKIKIADGDEVYIGDEKIDAKELEK